MIKNFTLCLLACLLLSSGCAFKPSDQLVSMFGEYCEEAGYEKDSDDYFRCVKRVAAKK